MAIPLENYYISKPLVPGKWARNNPINYAQSYAAAASGIAFGRAVQIASTDPGLVQVPSSSGLVFAGVALESVDTHNTDYSTETYLAGAAVGVVTQGSVMVHVEEAVTPASPVRVRITANTGVVPGSFCTTVDAGKTILLAPACAKFESASSSGIGETGLMAELFLMKPFTFTAD